MLDIFLRLWPAIKLAILLISDLSNTEKNINYSFSNEEIDFITNCHNILEIFIHPTKLFQAQSYPTISLAIPHIYRIYTHLNDFKNQELLVSN